MSKAENMGVSLSQVNSQTGDHSCPKQTSPEQTCEFTECTHSELSESKNMLGSEAVENEPRETSCAETSIPNNEKIQAFCEDVPDCSFTDHLVLPSEDVSKSSQTYNISCSQQNTSENEPAVTDARLPCGGVHENLLTISEGMTQFCPNEPLQSPPRDANNRCLAGENSCLRQSMSEQTLEVAAGISFRDPLVVNNELGFQLVQTELGETVAGTSCNIISGEIGAPLEPVVKSSSIEQLKLHGVPITTPSTKLLGPSPDDMAKKSYLDASNNSAFLGHKGKRASKSLKKKNMLRGSDRVLRSRSDEKPKAPESSNKLADVSSIGKRKRKKPKNRRGKKIVADEYSRIRTHLRYLLNRINYEQSLIDAYSGEGWKGLSVEKLKPEKELQRATSEILRRKLKIRDLFQRLESLCAEGGFPKSLFDSEGLIDSEDIYCAKCGSKDLSADNDIILCDGSCDRGFHQFCLEPPLLREDIPPDDEGWLCPGCDCKVDCIDLVNDLLGTKLSITDNWEKVFPEAAAGHNLDPNFGLPSDDSDDNDYNPDGPETDELDQGDEPSSDGSSSDASDFTSTSDQVEALADDKEYSGLPSEDSEDDDEYNPDAPELDEKVTQESSSSDFTSDSEDLTTVLEDNRSSGNDDVVTFVSPLGDSNGPRSKLRGNKQSLNNELLSILEHGEDGAAPVYGKRCIERLDYKKLYDETYGNVSSDSSDDEYWSENDEPRKRTESTGEGSSASPDRKALVIRRGKTKDAKENLNETERNPRRRVCRKLDSEDTNISLAKSHEGSSTPGSWGKSERSSYKRLGEDVTQKLYNSFKENQYPDRTTKASLAKELGLTYSQVGKWFDNTRWSFNHPSSTNAKLANTEKSTSTPQSNKNTVGRVPSCNGAENGESPKTGVEDKGCRIENVKVGEMATPECGSSKPTIQTSRKRNRESKLGDQASDRSSKIGVIIGLTACSSKAKEAQTNGRTRRKRSSAV